jgi:hypothetical protein
VGTSSRVPWTWPLVRLEIVYHIACSYDYTYLLHSCKQRIFQITLLRLASDPRAQRPLTAGILTSGASRVHVSERVSSFFVTRCRKRSHSGLMREPFHSLSSHKEEKLKRGETQSYSPTPRLPVFSSLLFLLSLSSFPLLFRLHLVFLLPLLACGQISPDHRRMGRGQEPTLACAAADFLVPSRMQYSVFSLFSSKPLPPPPKKANKYSMYRPATLHPILFSALPIPFLVGILAAEVWIFILLF